jgi:hypothetical protein
MFFYFYFYSSFSLFLNSYLFYLDEWQDDDNMDDKIFIKKT